MVYGASIGKLTILYIELFITICIPNSRISKVTKHGVNHVNITIVRINAGSSILANTFIKQSTVQR